MCLLQERRNKVWLLLVQWLLLLACCLVWLYSNPLPLVLYLLQPVKWQLLHVVELTPHGLHNLNPFYCLSSLQAGIWWWYLHSNLETGPLCQLCLLFIWQVHIRGHLYFHPWTAWQHSGAILACLLVILKHISLAPILLTLTLRDVYNVKDPSRSLILISEDSPGGELYYNHKL